MNATSGTADYSVAYDQLTTLQGRDIVIVSLQPWYYNIGSNCKNIATMLSENNRVLYVNKPLNRKTVLSKNKDAGVQKHYDLVKEKGNTALNIADNMWELYPSSVIESINWLPATSLFKMYNKQNNKRFAKDIQQAVKLLGFKNIIIFNDNDIYNGYYLKEFLSPSLYIYYCRDFLQGYDYWKKHSTVLEPELIASSDIVVTNSIYYAQYCSRYNASSFYIGQGCNLELFNPNKKYSVPEDLLNIDFPIIGYVGAVDAERLDMNVIKAIAQNKKFSVVLVGPQDERFTKSDLHKMTNVHFLGRKPLEKLPEYINAFDVCINPQVKNKITKGNYPLKIDEYLAMGKPVVATNTEAMGMFKNYTYLANTPEEYSALIDKALSENSGELEAERKSFAQTHTWQNSMNKLYKVINTHLHTKNLQS